MFVRWKRRKLKRDDQPVWVDSETGKEVEPWQGLRDGYDVQGGSFDNTRRVYVRNIGWRRVMLAKGIDPNEIRTKPAPDVYALDAVLVESIRINGKPRQRYIGHLATIREGDLEAGADPQWRVQFWGKVAYRLDELDVNNRPPIIATIEQRVSRPACAEVLAAYEEPTDPPPRTQAVPCLL